MAAPATVAPTRSATRWAHAVVAGVAAAGLVLQLVLVLIGGSDTAAGGAVADRPVGERLVRLFSYFTIQSNILVLVAAVLLSLRPGRDGRLWRVVRLDALLGIIITGLVFATVLAPIVHLSGAAGIANLLLHDLSPLLFVLAWLVTGPRPRIDWSSIGWAFVWPVLWIIYTLIHGAATHWYPYPFLDVDDLGYPIALRNIVAILVLAAIIAVVLRLLDRLPAVTR